MLREGVVGVANLAEVVDVCVQVRGNEERIVRERLTWLLSGGLEIAVLEAGAVLDAGALRARHYRHRRCEISHGDCFALALAKHRRLPLATADPAWRLPPGPKTSRSSDCRTRAGGGPEARAS